MWINVFNIMIFNTIFLFLLFPPPTKWHLFIHDKLNKIKMNYIISKIKRLHFISIVHFRHSTNYK